MEKTGDGGGMIQCCQPSRPSAISAGWTGRCQGRPGTAKIPSSTVTGRHRAVTINTYTLTLERAVQDINRFIYISRLSIGSKNSGLYRADVEGSCFSQDSGEIYLL